MTLVEAKTEHERLREKHVCNCLYEIRETQQCGVPKTLSIKTGGTNRNGTPCYRMNTLQTGTVLYQVAKKCKYCVYYCYLNSHCTS